MAKMKDVPVLALQDLSRVVQTDRLLIAPEIGGRDEQFQGQARRQ
jgi:hypothetical protein